MRSLVTTAPTKALRTPGIAVGHNYTPLYHRHFAARRKLVHSVLEIGVGGTSSVEGYEPPAGGQSLRMWSRYFPNASIVGIDIFDKAVSGPRIHFERGNAAEAEFLERVIERHGPFDIVVDDGSHIGREIIASFAVLWEAVEPGGFYVIEDPSLAYHHDWEGGPPGTPGTAAELLKGLIDKHVAEGRRSWSSPPSRQCMSTPKSCFSSVRRPDDFRPVRREAPPNFLDFVRPRYAQGRNRRMIRSERGAHVGAAETVRSG